MFLTRATIETIALRRRYSAMQSDEGLPAIGQVKSRRGERAKGRELPNEILV
jgi:hypothetical protein